MIVRIFQISFVRLFQVQFVSQGQHDMNWTSLSRRSSNFLGRAVGFWVDVFLTGAG